MKTRLEALRGFITEAPDTDELLEQLATEVPGATVTCGTIDDTAEIRLRLTTANIFGPGAAAVALLAEWLRTFGHTATDAEGISTELDNNELTIELSTTQTHSFLFWYRARLTANLPAQPRPASSR
ncbi:hypothetical protein [Nocardia carnea]|uniref:hypothetical protein n=1 Tax=Nocardia carnea TaxID=37328 RepID=UPI002458BAF1|nr:hypothetical protein [Nocardia carnea]